MLKKGGAHSLFISVMSSAMCDVDAAIFYMVNEAVFFIDTFDCFFILVQPIEVVFPSII